MYYSENEIICALISFLLHGIACLLLTTCKMIQGGGGHGEVRADAEVLILILVQYTLGGQKLIS